jgi:hypothetical protein
MAKHLVEEIGCAKYAEAPAPAAEPIEKPVRRARKQ